MKHENGRDQAFIRYKGIVYFCKYEQHNRIYEVNYRIIVAYCVYCDLYWYRLCRDWPTGSPLMQVVLGYCCSGTVILIVLCGMIRQQ